MPDQITARLSADRAHAEAESDGYSATALGSHWFERPEPETAAAAGVGDGEGHTGPGRTAGRASHPTGWRAMSSASARE